ncbi:MAG: endolytic transglycosylase MltG [Syntrophorhabdaceae bacterium]|nr:endolytic transglycosylase MltG [Syntrophorhabdaceae bacterium]
MIPLSKKKHHSPRVLRIAALFVISGTLLFTFLLFDSHSSRDWKITTVSIPKGSPMQEIAYILSAENILPHPVAFRGITILTRTTRQLQYGEYTFPNPPSAYTAWKKLIAGDVVKYPVVVRPGSNLYDVASLLEAYSLTKPDAFLEAAMSAGTLAKLGIDADSAEGYLVPDTYNLVKNMKPVHILEVMVQPFKTRFTPEMERKAGKAGLSVHEVVTIASIIEKETGIPHEKPLISAVIRNRLKLGMPLQMDPTVIYEVKRFNGTITRDDLRTPGPYNTYMNAGLPPGPISNPGLASLKAALNPANTDYLYFVSNNDGTHTFSETFEQHSVAVKNLRRLLRDAAANKLMQTDNPSPDPVPATPPLPPSEPS